MDRADFSKLTAAITAAREKLEADDIGNYTDESVSALRAKLQEAETLAADSNATQESVDAAVNALTEAMNLTMKDADYTAVDAAIAKAASIERDRYTAESLAAFDAAYGAVEVVRGLKVDEQDRVTAMAEAIENALKLLVVDEMKEAKAQLQTAIAEAEAFISQNALYDTSELQAAVDAAKDMLEEESIATIQEINEQAEILKNGVANFQKVFKNEKGTGVYLSDLEWSSERCGWEGRESQKDMPIDGGTIALWNTDSNNWEQFQKGIGTHADSEIVYNLNGAYKKFEAYVGLDFNADEGDYVNGVIFKVYLDKAETPAYESPVMSKYADRAYVAVDVAGVQTMRLVVDKNGDNSGDHADWADAKLYATLNGVDITGLNDMIAEAKAKKENDYTGTSWTTLQAAIQAAEEVAAKGNTASTEEVEEVKAALKAAIEGLVARADFSKLTAAITAAREKLEADDIGNYTDESVSALRAKLQEAEAVAEDTDAAQEDVDAAAEALNAAMNLTLKDADYTAVDAAIAKAAGIERDRYTAESLETFDAAYEAVEVVRGLKADEQERVTAMAKAIEDALKLLVIDTASDAKEALQKKVNEAKEKAEEDYTEASWAALQEAIKRAEEVLSDEEAVRKEVNAALNALQSAADGLVKRPEEPGEPEQPEEPTDNQPDNAALETVLKNARTKDLSGYTEASANAFRLALAEAEKILANAKATQAEIDAALKALQTAENSLVKKPAETAKPSAKPIPAVGKVYKVKGMFRCKITKSGATGGTVTIVKLLKKSKSKVVIPATVKINGYSFKVTAVSANAFKNDRKLKSVTIGKNVKTIGRRAFFKCSDLKNITWKGTKAPKIGKQAFKGIQKKCKITVSKKMTKKQLKAFKARLKKAGIGGKAVYRKK